MSPEPYGVLVPLILTVAPMAVMRAPVFRINAPPCSTSYTPPVSNAARKIRAWHCRPSA